MSDTLSLDGRLRELIAQWREREKAAREDRWCNTEDAPVWRAIHEYRANELERCANQLEALVRDAAPAPPSIADMERAVVEHAAAHWFTQGGEMQFGALDCPQNPDELIAEILRVVRRAGGGDAAPAPAIRSTPTCIGGSGSVSILTRPVNRRTETD